MEFDVSARTHDDRQPESVPRRKFRALASRLDWNLIKTFVVVGEECNLTRAAQKLFVTQPAVSQAVKRLERELGCQLMQRHGPQIALSPAGEEVLACAQAIRDGIAKLEALPAEAGSQDVVGRVRLLVVSRVCSPVYDRFLADFHRRHPQVDLEVQVMRSQDLLHALSQNTASLGIGLCQRRPPVLDGCRLIPQRYAFFCGRSHPLYGHCVAGLDALAHENFITFDGDQLGDALSALTLFREYHGFDGRVLPVSSSLDEVCRLVVCGFGIGCLPEHVVAQQVEQGLLHRLPPEQGVADIDLHLLWNRNRTMRRAESVFKNELLKAFEDL